MGEFTYFNEEKQTTPIYINYMLQKVSKTKRQEGRFFNIKKTNSP